MTIPPEDIDFSNRLKPSAFFRYIQHIASLHAEGLQLGYQELQKAGLFWVLSWVKIEVEEYPRYRDTITISTWPHDRYRLFSLRDFHFADQHGHVFARARTAWLLVDAAAKRITSLDRLPHPVPYLLEKQALEALPQKLTPPDDAQVVYEKLVAYSDLDINQHVNNARYVEYMLDCYPLDFHLAHQVRSLVLSFVSECKYGERLALARQVSTAENGAHQIIARLAGDDHGSQRIVFQALVEWSERL